PIPHAGHASYLDNDALFNQRLLQLLEGVRNECTD
ncbi:MAG TPA: alpha/beta hydrolase, partial [Erwiniaceae bacterium]|nr:alpha/beta hydrolase [Erwiniaceae bacterium]